MTYQEVCHEVMQLEQEIQVLQQRKYREEQGLAMKKKELAQYNDDLYREHYDVKQLEKNSIGTLIKKISGKYQKEYEKETQEYLAAKAKYDEFNIIIEDQKAEVRRYQNEIFHKEQEIKRRKQDTEKYSRQAACRRKSGNKNRSNSSKKRKSGEKLWVL